MNTKQQRIAIADFCGWTAISQYDNCIAGFPQGFPTPYNAHRSEIPDYPNDLNAMHEAEEKLISNNELQRYASWLTLATISQASVPDIKLDTSKIAVVAHATAAQRAEALLRTIGKWTDNP